MIKMRPTRAHGPELALLRAAAWPLVPLFALGVAIKNSLYDHGLLRPQKLSWPVVSVGNLSVGGTGKTPFVRELARLLEQRGQQVDVLTRGHGRRGQQVEMVPSDGPAWRYGDEPLLLARSGVPVFVGRRRYDAGVLAEGLSPTGAAFANRLHLLDDGLQHRKLARTVEIVLLDRQDWEGHLLPSGRLREPRSALLRADICVLREEDSDLLVPALAAMQTEDRARVWLLRRSTVLETALQHLRPQRALAFCGIARPGQFFEGLRQAGLPVVATVAFPDHHPYTERDVRALAAQARACHADVLVTTEKDHVRLDENSRKQLGAIAPLHVAGLAVSLQTPERCMEQLLGLLEKRTRVR
jgi:tetraacyldisaccharide 4'-kinase